MAVLTHAEQRHAVRRVVGESPATLRPAHLVGEGAAAGDDHAAVGAAADLRRVRQRAREFGAGIEAAADFQYPFHPPGAPNRRIIEETLSSVSWYSASATESATMPPPPWNTTRPGR